jgi:hypothetical protein
VAQILDGCRYLLLFSLTGYLLLFDETETRSYSLRSENVIDELVQFCTKVVLYHLTIFSDRRKYLFNAMFHVLLTRNISHIFWSWLHLLYVFLCWCRYCLLCIWVCKNDIVPDDKKVYIVFKVWYSCVYLAHPLQHLLLILLEVTWLKILDGRQSILLVVTCNEKEMIYCNIFLWYVYVACYSASQYIGHISLVENGSNILGHQSRLHYEPRLMPWAPLLFRPLDPRTY